MRRLKTDELGLHPLTLQDLGYLQSSILEGLQFLADALTGKKPCILHGFHTEFYNIGGSNFQWEVWEGIYWSGSELLFHETSYHIGGQFDKPKLNIAETNLLGPVTYRNGQTKNVYKLGYIQSNLSSGIDLLSIPRLDNLLKSRLGIDNINNSITALQNGYSNMVNGHNYQENRLNSLDQQLTNHIQPGGGGHPWTDISNKPYTHASAYLADIGVTSPAFPHTLGSNCKRVAGTSNDSLYEIKLPNNAVISGQYHVYGSIVGVKSGTGGSNYQGVLWDDCNDLTWSIVLKQNDKFHLAVRELNATTQDLWFEFMVVDLSKL